MIPGGGTPSGKTRRLKCIIKQIKHIMKINFKRMRQKIIDYCWLQYLNDLFEIKQIFYDPSSMLQSFEFVLATFFRQSRF